MYVFNEYQSLLSLISACRLVIDSLRVHKNKMVSLHQDIEAEIICMLNNIGFNE